ncbi:MAG: transglycosylase domain-containing protein, partial [Nocardioidaceae bacterium]
MKPEKGQGSGKKGAIRLRDTSGWDRANYVAGKILKWGSISGVVLLFAGVLTIYIVYKTITIPNENAAFEAQTSTVYYSDGTHVLGTFAVQNRHSVPLAEIPISMRNAVVSAENRTFWTDPGLDPKGIVRAAWSNLTSDGGTQGASTITQQYVKLLYLSQDRTWSRKIREAFISVKTDQELSKRQVLEGYLNTIYFGRGAYGVDAAAEAYFQVSAKALTVSQSAVLAAVLNSPSNFDPAVSRSNVAPLLARYRYVLAGMQEMGNLSAADASRYATSLPTIANPSTRDQYGGQRGYLMTMVQEALATDGFTPQEIYGGGLKIVTTFSHRDMLDAQQAVYDIRPKGKLQLHVGLASVEPGTGAVRAVIGGRDFLGSQQNWATNLVQPGSTFKAFAVAAALGNGFTLEDTFNGNSPFVLPDGTLVHNEGEAAGIPSGQSYGTISLKYATEASVNTAFVDLTTQMQNGPQRIIAAAEAAGIPSSTPGLHPFANVALGTASVSPLAMADSYATFAANGVHAGWYVIQSVSDPGGPVYEHNTEATRAFSPAVASNVTSALQGVIQAGTGQRALALGRPAAGKTGTATAASCDTCDEHVSSSWFVGYTPQLATAVSYTRGDGNDALDGYLDTYFGADYPTQTWTAYMKNALQGTKVIPFPAPGQLGGTQPTPTYIPPTYTPPTTTQPTRTEPTRTATTHTVPTTPTHTVPTTPTISTTPTQTSPSRTQPTTTRPTTTGPTTTGPTTTGPTTTGPTT